MNKYTLFRTKYTNRPEVRGQSEFDESITQPDCSFSVRELVEQASIASLPSMATLQPWLEDGNDNVDDSTQDLRFGGDRALMLEKFLEANSMRRNIFDKLKQRFNKMREAEPERQFTKEDITTIDGINLDEL